MLVLVKCYDNKMVKATPHLFHPYVANKTKKAGLGVILNTFVTGVLVLVVTLVGCCGISRESHSLVLTYSLLLSLVFLAEVGAGVLAYLYR